MRVVTSMISGSFLLGKELFININLIFSSMVSIEISVNFNFTRNNFTEILLAKVNLNGNQFIISF